VIDNHVTVSVVIPTYNSARFLASAIESVLGQSERPDEIIVVDDGSTDGTSDVLGRYGARIAVVTHPRNRGLPSARNSGIRVAAGSVIGFLDADDVWEPSMVEKQKRAFVTHETLGLCFTSLWDCDAGLMPLRGPRKFRRRVCEAVFSELYMRAFPMPPSTVFARRAVLERVGMFDESMLKKQDLECWLRVAMAYPVSCIPEPLCRRRVHAASLTSEGPREVATFYESRVFELCGEAAGRLGIPLPMPVAERQILSLRRRWLEHAAYGDRTAAAVYRAALAELRPVSTRERCWAAALSLQAKWRRTIGRLYFKRQSDFPTSSSEK